MALTMCQFTNNSTHCTGCDDGHGHIIYHSEEGE